MLSLGLSLLGFGKSIMSWIAAGFKWIFADIHRVIILVLVGVALWLWATKADETARADKMTDAAGKWESAYVLMVEAARQAKLAAQFNAQRVAEEYRKANEDAQENYDRGLADNRRALNEWMRQNRARSVVGNNSSTGPEMPDGPLPPARETEFLVTGRDLEIASDNYSQLIALIAWAEAIGEVNTTE